MCVTCGCSDGAGVRITDLATGEATTLDAHADLHQHTDAEGHVIVHAHPVTVEAPHQVLPEVPARERRDA